VRPDPVTAAVLADVGAALRASPVRSRVGVYVNRRGRLAAVVRRADPEANALVGMVHQLAYEALRDHRRA
jgi:hypothetical protein